MDPSGDGGKEGSFFNCCQLVRKVSEGGNMIDWFKKKKKKKKKKTKKTKGIG